MTPNTRTLKGQSYCSQRWANPVWPKGSKSRGFSTVSRSPYSPGLHQSHPQLPVYIRFTIHFRFLFSPPFHVRFSVPVRIRHTLSFPFTSGSPSTSGFSFRLRFTCVCQSRYSFCLLFSLSPFCPELSFPFLPSLSAPFCRPASPLPCSG